MKILIISFYNDIWATHFATELELAQRHLDDGDTVELLGCDGCITACEQNPTGLPALCDMCRVRRLKGTRLLSAPVVEHRFKKYLPANVEQLEREFLESIHDVESAKAARYQGQDLGWGALSSTMSFCRDPFCEGAESRTFILRFARAAVRCYMAVDGFLASRTQSFDRVYIFNGRFAVTRAAFRACQKHRMDVRIHERGSTTQKFDVLDNVTPHDREAMQARIQQNWDQPSSEDRHSKGRAFFLARRQGRAEQDLGRNFVRLQVIGSLPETWDKEKRNVAIFTSSEDEFAGIGDEWRNRLYRTQTEAIHRLIGDAQGRYPDMHFYVRVHPNLLDVHNRDVDALLATRSPNCTLIEPGSSISSYSLMEAVDLVVTFGSTVGIECTFWGKPSILAGPALYDELDVAYVVASHEHLLDLLGCELAPKSVDNAIKYGYYLQTFGTPFKYWNPDGFCDGRFRGKPLICFRSVPPNWLPTSPSLRRLLRPLVESRKFKHQVLFAMLERMCTILAYLWHGFRRRLPLVLSRLLATRQGERVTGSGLG